MDISIAQVLLLPDLAALRHIDLSGALEVFVQVVMLLFLLTTSTTIVLLAVSSCVGIVGGIVCLRSGADARGGAGESPQPRA